jgi:hypothetical protein
MPNFNCPRCGWNFRQTKDFKTHLRKKKICPPTLDDITLETARKEMEQRHSYKTTTMAPTQIQQVNTINNYGTTINNYGGRQADNDQEAQHI